MTKVPWNTTSNLLALFNLFVAIDLPTGKCMTVFVDGSASVEDLKANIQSLEGIPADWA